MSASLHGSYRAGFTPLTQIRLTNVAYLRFYKCGHRFEIACYRNKVLNWRAKIETDIREVLQVEAIFTNVSKGNLANAKQMTEAFGTTDTLEISKEMLDKGELQVSEEERQAQYDIMFTDIAAIVSEKSVHPENNRPYTTPIIQNAMRQIHYSVSLNKSAKKQALDVITRLRAIMPIARVHMLISVIVPTELSAKMELLLMSLNRTASAQAVSQVAVAVTQRGPYTAGSNVAGLTGVSAPTPADPTPANGSSDAAAATAGGMYFLNVRVNPEHYKTIVDFARELSKGKGRVEILKLKDMDGVAVAVPLLSSGTETSTDTGTSSSTTANVRREPSDTESSVAEDEETLHQATSGFSAFGADSDSDAEGESTSLATAGTAVDSAQTRTQADTAVSREVEAEPEGGSDSEEEDVEAKVDRMMREIALKKSQATAKKTGKAGGKKGKKGKQGGSERESGNVPGRQSILPPGPPTSTESAPTAEKIAVPVPAPVLAPGAIACRTCGGSFPDAAAHREHFKSEWHRHNLKQKMHISAGAAGRILTEEEFCEGFNA